MSFMKAFPAQLSFMAGSTPVRRNVGQLLRLMALVLVLVIFYSFAFHYIMIYEGRQGEYSWFTAFYWSMTVMSTLGFGDITFHSDLGRAFSMVVLVSGLISLLIIFPFTFIQFFWAPWLEAQRNSQAPRSLSPAIRQHTIITAFEPVAEALLHKLAQYDLPYVVLAPTVNEALTLSDHGYRVMVGEADSPTTYHRAQVNQAALVVATGEDEVNTNIAFTVREICQQVPVVTLASGAASVDILELAGSDHVLQLGEMLGQTLARRAGSSQTLVHIVGRFEQLCVAEVTVSHTTLAGCKVRDSGLRERYGVTLAGLWDRGRFHVPGPDEVLGENVVAILVGHDDQLQALNNDLAREPHPGAEGPVLIIGGGRVGRAAAALLKRQGTPCRVLERDPAQVPPDDDCYVVGDAAELDALQQAGLTEAPTVIITTQNDDINIYLTIYCRRLRPDIQIVCRATHDRNIDTLHRAGANFVMSYASLGANTIFNLLRHSNLLMVTEGLMLLRVPTPSALVGSNIANSNIRTSTGCSVVALLHGERTFISPPPDTILPAGSELVLIGTVEAEQAYLSAFGHHGSRPAR